MKLVNFTEFRGNASTYLREVESGETLVILRNGRPIAEVTPCAGSSDAPSWKRSRLGLVSKGAALADAIIEGRSGEAVS